MLYQSPGRRVPFPLQRSKNIASNFNSIVPLIFIQIYTSDILNPTEMLGVFRYFNQFPFFYKGGSPAVWSGNSEFQNKNEHEEYQKLVYILEKEDGEGRKRKDFEWDVTASGDPGGKRVLQEREQTAGYGWAPACEHTCLHQTGSSP